MHEGFDDLTVPGEGLMVWWGGRGGGGGGRRIFSREQRPLLLRVRPATAPPDHSLPTLAQTWMVFYGVSKRFLSRLTDMQVRQLDAAPRSRNTCLARHIGATPAPHTLPTWCTH